MTKDELIKIIADKDERIAELKAENLLLKTEEVDETEALIYAQNLIDDSTIEELEEKLKWLNEVVEYIDVYVGYHREIEEDDGE